MPELSFLNIAVVVFIFGVGVGVQKLRNLSVTASAVKEAIALSTAEAHRELKACQNTQCAVIDSLKADVLALSSERKEIWDCVRATEAYGRENTVNIKWLCDTLSNMKDGLWAIQQLQQEKRQAEK